MARFEIAYAATASYEGDGVWTCVPNDKGGETYSGISRKYNPHWDGWSYIDQCKGTDGIPQGDYEEKLKSSVVSFYHKNYWNKIQGDKLPLQSLANLLYDIAVNQSVRRAGRYLQRALNRLNRQERDFKDLIVDGKIGEKTIKELKSFLKFRKNASITVDGIHAVVGGEWVLLHWIQFQMSQIYWNNAGKDKSQEDFFVGWSARQLSSSAQLLSDAGVLLLNEEL